MPITQSNNTSIFIGATILALLLSLSAAAQTDASVTREQQAALLRVAVEERIGELDEEYAVRAAELRAQFDARRQELEETTDSEFVLSNALAPIGRVYQDSLAALQREISARQDSVYAAQNQANEELSRQGAISAGTWSRISSTPLADIDPVPAVAVAEVESVIVEEAAPQEEDSAEAGATIATVQPPQPSGCEIAWYPDSDRDLFGDAGAVATLACYPGRPAGFVDNDYDCDDSDATINPITGHCRDAQQ